jgi:hypothetical protein
VQMNAKRAEAYPRLVDSCMEHSSEQHRLKT